MPSAPPPRPSGEETATLPSPPEGQRGRLAAGPGRGVSKGAALCRVGSDELGEGSGRVKPCLFVWALLRRQAGEASSAPPGLPEWRGSNPWGWRPPSYTHLAGPAYAISASSVGAGTHPARVKVDQPGAPAPGTDGTTTQKPRRGGRFPVHGRQESAAPTGLRGDRPFFLGLAPQAHQPSPLQGES